MANGNVSRSNLAQRLIQRLPPTVRQPEGCHCSVQLRWAITPLGMRVRAKQLYVANYSGNTVSVIDTQGITPPSNTTPVVEDPAYTITTVHADTGVVDGALHVTDPDGDTLSYGCPVTTDKGDNAVINPDARSPTPLPSRLAMPRPPTMPHLPTSMTRQTYLGLAIQHVVVAAG